VPLLLSVIGVVTIGFGGWLGGEIAYIKRMAVEAVEKLAKKKKDKEQPRLRRAR
jgi:uncharacterized membrane protein